MGRTWRKNSEYGNKKDHKDVQRQIRKETQKVQKASHKHGEPETDMWGNLKQKGPHG